jgi:Phage integrase family
VPGLSQVRPHEGSHRLDQARQSIGNALRSIPQATSSELMISANKNARDQGADDVDTNRDEPCRQSHRTLPALSPLVDDKEAATRRALCAFHFATKTCHFATEGERAAPFRIRRRLALGAPKPDRWRNAPGGPHGRAICNSTRRGAIYRRCIGTPPVPSASGFRFKLPKTKAGRRDLTLPDIVVETLREHMRRLLETRMALGLGRLPDDALLFADLDGGPISPNSVSAAWSDLAKSLGIPEISYHALRHTHASQLIDNNVDIVTISKRLGHAKPDITSRIYADLFRKDDAKASAAINATLKA